jgi:hypothetical protein
MSEPLHRKFFIGEYKGAKILNSNIVRLKKEIHALKIDETLR